MKVTITLEDVSEDVIEANVDFGNPPGKDKFLKSEATRSQRMGIVLMEVLQLASATHDINQIEDLIRIMASAFTKEAEFALN